MLAAYRALGRATLDLARLRGDLPADAIAALEALLAEPAAPAHSLAAPATRAVAR